MRLQDIMQTPVKTVSPNDSAVMANEMMWRQRFHHLVVVNDHHQIVGILSDTDLGGPEATEIDDQLQVKHVMSTQVVAVPPTTTVQKALHLIRGRRIHCLPIVEEGQLIGIATSSDIRRLAKQGVPQHSSLHKEDRECLFG